MVLDDRLGDVLQQDRLAGARLGNDQAALSLADRRQQVHDARGQRFRPGFQDDLLVRVDRRQLVKISTRVLVRRPALDLFDAKEARAGALLVRFRGSGEQQALPELQLLDQRRGT